MADVITRFKLETTQYDSKLRDTSKALADYTKQATLAGKEFDKFTRENVEAARSFGNIATSATNSKDKINELVSAFNDVAKVYNNLTKEQQQSDFGKALGESMQQLSGRIREAKAELNSTPGLLEKLKEKFVINIDAIKLFNVGLSAAKGALDVAKDAFFASESTVDEWGRVMDSSKSLYEGFLTALNTGDISGYLNRIDEIVSAARTAYNELDRLGTMKTIQAPRISAQQTENDRMRMMIQTGRYIAPVDGRRATMADGQRLTKEQIQRIEQQLQNGMKTMVGLVSNEVKQTGRAIDAVYKRQAAELGMNIKEFRSGTSSMAEFDKRMQGYDNYQKWRASHTTIDQQSGREIVARGNPFEQFAKWGVFRVDGDRYNDLVKLIQQRDQQAAQAYGMQGQTYRTMNRAEGVTVRSIMNGGTGGGGTTPVPVKIEAFDTNKALLAGAKSVDTMPSVWSMLGDQDLRDMLGIGKKQTFDLGKDISTKWKVGKNGQLIDKTGKDEKQERTAEEQLQGTQTMISSLQSIVTGLDQLGIQLPKELTNIFGVLQTITGIVGAIQTMQTVGTFLGIFNNGGIARAANGFVGGNTFSGDQIPIMVNSGELILNRAQQGAIASQLEGGMAAMQLSAVITGEQLRLVLNNNGRRTGRGEYVTTNFR